MIEQITYTSETSITGFSLGTLNINRMGKDKNGLDSPYVDTLDCSNYPYTWQTKTGKPLNTLTGYVAEGLFTSQEEIDQWAAQPGMSSSFP